MKLSVNQIKQLKATGRFDPMQENWWIVCVEDLDGVGRDARGIPPLFGVSVPCIC